MTDFHHQILDYVFKEFEDCKKLEINVFSSKSQKTTIFDNATS